MWGLLFPWKSEPPEALEPERAGKLYILAGHLLRVFGVKTFDSRKPDRFQNGAKIVKETQLPSITVVCRCAT